MKFRFDPDLDFQNQAIDAAVRLFEGTPRMETGFALISENGVVGNRLALDDDALLANLQQVQTDPGLHNGTPIPVSPELGSRDFSVEMETGTGKTYVYLRTALELYETYGFRKFIVVVPSVAIREGVLKTLRITREHFAQLYDNVPYHFYEYDSGNLARVRQFAASNDVEIMVMTLDSFNKDTNIFNRRMDRMMGLKPLKLVRSARPILHPEMAPALVADALDRLIDRRPYYLYEDPKWRFDKVANLNKILVEREDAIKSKEIRTRIRSTLGDLVGQRTFRRTYLWPQEDRDVTDDRRLGLVVVDLDYPAGDKGTRAFITAVLKQHGEAFRNYRNPLVFLVPDRAEIDRASEAARNLLALESIAADYGGSDRLTDKQQENLEKDLSNARSALPQIVYQVYRHIFIPAEGEEWLHFDMGMQLLKGDRSLSQEVWEHLVGRDRILERLDPHLIRGQRWTLWPEPEQPLAVSQLRDYFARYTQLPMLASDEVLLQTIVRGVEIKLFGYGQRASEGESFLPLYFGQSISPIELEIADTTWLVPPDMAQKQLLSAIAGHVLDAGNVPLSGVTVRLSPGGQAVTTGADGEFAFDNLSPGTYTLAPSKAGYTFSPSSRSIGLAGEDVVGLEFVGSEVVGPPVTYELRGRVQTDEGLPLSHVRLAIDPPVAGDVTSDGQGEYVFRGLQEGTYRVRPEKAGYGFKPEELSVAVVDDLSGQDFIATEEARGAQRIEIRTRLPWEKWYDFYSDELDPLMSAGAEIEIRLELEASAEQELGSDVIERIEDSLRKYDEDAELEAG